MGVQPHLDFGLHRQPLARVFALRAGGAVDQPFGLPQRRRLPAHRFGQGQQPQIGAQHGKLGIAGEKLVQPAAPLFGFVSADAKHGAAVLHNAVHAGALAHRTGISLIGRQIESGAEPAAEHLAALGGFAGKTAEAQQVV